ncbi:hypothetical protein Zmor_023423 [Zophobas morio]|uniref:Uncharacterized protein n=1 Tax=Zophobas morio TaxID=2755281 RepID=A0AA38HZU0_9CUCU|nr:hypothetical protein Zmor_023423 [Zophobas morio]
MHWDETHECKREEDRHQPTKNQEEIRCYGCQWPASSTEIALTAIQRHNRQICNRVASGNLCRALKARRHKTYQQVITDFTEDVRFVLDLNQRNFAFADDPGIKYPFFQEEPADNELQEFL